MFRNVHDSYDVMYTISSDICRKFMKMILKCIHFQSSVAILCVLCFVF